MFIELGYKKKKLDRYKKSLSNLKLLLDKTKTLEAGDKFRIKFRIPHVSSFLSHSFKNQINTKKKKKIVFELEY